MYAFPGEKSIKIVLYIDMCIYLLYLYLYICNKMHFSFLWENMSGAERGIKDVYKVKISFSFQIFFLVHSVFISTYGYALSEQYYWQICATGRH